MASSKPIRSPSPRARPIALFEHIFYGDLASCPSELLRAFPELTVSSQGEAEQDGSTPLLWVRLHAKATVAEQLRSLRTLFPTAHLLMMSDIPNDLEALAVFSMAAKAYCNAHAGEQVLRHIASVVEHGGMWIGESIMQRLIESVQVPSASVSILQKSLVEENRIWREQLSLRELEVAKAIASGVSNKEIAQQMGITERTVKAHVGSILDKLQLKSRLQLALLVKEG